MKNTIPTSIPALVIAAHKAAYGAGLYGTALPLLQNTETNINADLNALTDSIMAYGLGKDEVTARRETVRLNVDTSRMFLTLGRDVFKPTLGSEYNQAWDNTGLIGSLVIPRNADDVMSVLLSYKNFLASHPELEFAAKEITAAKADDLFTDLKAAVNAVDQQEGINTTLMAARDAKAKVLGKRISNLIHELDMRMDGLDGRWQAFGLNMPDALETPEAPEHVSAVLIGPTAAAVKWDAAQRAEYYRVFKKIIGIDTEYVAAGSPADLDFALENLPANSTIEIVVTAVNNGGESPVSEKITIVTQ